MKVTLLKVAFVLALSLGVAQVLWSSFGIWWSLYKYDNSTTHNLTVGWIPNKWRVASEVVNYGSTDDKGDHVIGDKTTKISANTIQQKTTGGYSDVVGTVHDGEGNGDIDLDPTTGIGFRTWDDRCEDS